MKLPSHRSWNWAILVTALAVATYLGTRSSEGTIPKDYVLPNDNFDQRTLTQIHSALDQYHVAETPHDHAVYMITGGLGVANPRMMGWDSDGNMDFAGNSGPIYHIRETAFSPENWYTKPQKKGVMWTDGPQEGFQPVPWVYWITKTGVPYYEWDQTPYGFTQFYFQEGNTYIVLNVDFIGQSKPAFPEALPSHLVPLGNPVTNK